MQPQQPTPNYDFIMSPNTPPPQKRSFGGGSLVSRILLILGGLFVLMVIVAILMRLVGGGGGLDKAKLLSVAQDQTEIVRLATIGSEESVTDANKNFSITAQLSLTSERKELTDYMIQNGIKLKAEDLALKQSSTIDTQLKDAKSTSTFDTVYKGIMQRSLETYRADLNTAYMDSGPNGKKILKASDDAAKLLLAQLNGQTN